MSTDSTPEDHHASLPFRRRPGHGGTYGLGLEQGACPERGHNDDTLAERMGLLLRPYRSAMCFLCGRITARRDTDGAAWCGGALPAELRAQDWKP